MKKLLQFFLISLFVLQTNLFPQSPIVQQIINSVNIDSLIYFVKELSGEVPTIINGTSQTILSRNALQPGNALAATYIKQKLESYGLTVAIQNFSATGNNVLATKVGSQYPNKKIIICAHYDSVPEGTKAPGADDNASGTAAVLEAVRIFTPYTFPYTIVFALWDEEEITYPLTGLVGSDYYASQVAAAGDSILAVINLDAMAYDSNNDGKCAIQEPEIIHSVQIRNNMREINNQYGINLNTVAEPPTGDSDQASFWFKGYDAIHLFCYTFDDWNSNYHTSNDRVQYFNQPYYLKMIKLALGTLAFHALYLNFDIIHTRMPAFIPPQGVNTNIFIYTAMQIGNGSSAPRIYYRTKGIGGTYGNFNEVIGVPTGGGNYTFNIPSLPNGTFVQYYLAAQNENSTIIRTSPLGGSGYNPPGNIPPGTFYEFLVADLFALISDEANSTANWTATGGWNTTTEDYVSPPTSFADSPGENYPTYSTSVLTYNNQIQVLNAYKTFLEFDTKWAMIDGYDYAKVEVTTNNGSSWTSLSGRYTYLGRIGPSFNIFENIYGGVQSNWVHEIMDITNFANHPFMLRYLFKSDQYDEPMDGWYIDNVKVSVFASILGQQPSIDKFYTRKDLDSVLFRIKLLDIYNHTFTSRVIFANLNSTQSDSLTLLDDGLHGDSLANDGIYGGYIPPRTDEGFYSLSLSTVDHQTNIYFKSPEILRVTTAGPVVLDSIRFIKGITNYYNLRPFVRNEGTSLTISNAKIQLSCSDPWVSGIAGAITLPSMVPNASVGASSWIAISYYDSNFPGYFNLKAEISVDGWTYWTDSIRINVVTGLEEEVSLPTAFKLEQNFPNPFNPYTRIKYQVSSNSHVSLNVYDVLGNEVASLVNEEKEAGYHSIDFNASDLPSGVYFYKLTAGNFISTRKMLLLK